MKKAHLILKFRQNPVGNPIRYEVGFVKIDLKPSDLSCINRNKTGPDYLSSDPAKKASRWNFSGSETKFGKPKRSVKNEETQRGILQFKDQSDGKIGDVKRKKKKENKINARKNSEGKQRMCSSHPHSKASLFLFISSWLFHYLRWKEGNF